eukprot:CAMPEP_0172548918 /NCGR_PEP_ID=MMETSP1067-20121228/18112_1 /TAXON_ID=265564 ORGANISM="Thalassiosira punctigera, Strain Tpunct2005C2" /NCGR_SAMPLE_ID=MMETSP1067 /ASSEMBLY_ACC=CAM_ASM_000444 /LENGTH=387 /DNA_ID=CAMNT_0013336217 /DNA_START=293 /DNA_END=1452 /DNA_ORIENTATION=-
MSSNQSSSSQPAMVQTILESFTRCFNPIDSACNEKVCSSKSGCDGARKKKSSSPLFGSVPRVSRSASGSSSDSRKQQRHRQQQQGLSTNVSYDAEGVAKAKKTHHRLSAEALAERSLKRKLEIFRGTGHETKGPPPPRSSQNRSSRHSPPPPSSGQSSPHGHLALSDDEEELIRLTQSRKRFACGMNMDRLHNNSPISSVARLFNFGLSEAQKPFGLCFATPVRTASAENAANLSDDKLTDDEYMMRRHVNGNVPHAATVSPGNDMDQSSYCEEETISSTLYFDQKYSHVVQTRPPMPLFQEHMLGCGGGCDGDELSKIISRRASNKGQVSSPPMETLVTTSSRRKGGSRGGIPRKGGSGGEPPSPVRIGTESISITTQSDDGSLGG